MRLSVKRLALTMITIAVFAGWLIARQQDEVIPAAKNRLVDAALFQKEFTRQIDFYNNSWPKQITVDGKNLELHYSFHLPLEKFIRKQLRRFFTQNSSVVVIDNSSGKILAAIDYTYKGRHFGNAITFSTTHPAASLFKIVTASALLNLPEVTPESRFRCRGRGTTLYKYQLDSRARRWDRWLTLKGAFYFSNNVVFARAARKYLGGGELTIMAKKFGFNTNIFADLFLSRSVFTSPVDKYNLAEKASGFNRDTLISPVHGALLASIIANDGIRRPLRVIDKILFEGRDVTNEVLNLSSGRVLPVQVSKEVADMMQGVVKRGTARKYMNYVARRFKRYLQIGGKTGRISGGVPHGTRDWFTVFAKPINGENQGISICVMNINGSSWYIKSSYIAKRIIEYYYTKIVPINKDRRS